MSNSKEVLICWILSQIGVRRNERADLTAYSALDLDPDKFKILYTDLKPKIKIPSYNNTGITTSIISSS